LYLFEDETLDIDEDTIHKKLHKRNTKLPSKSLVERDNDLLIRDITSDAPLKRVSQPIDKDWDEIFSYDYLRTAGRDVTVYIIDTGANMENPVNYI